MYLLEYPEYNNRFLSHKITNCKECKNYQICLEEMFKNNND